MQGASTSVMVVEPFNCLPTTTLENNLDIRQNFNSNNQNCDIFNDKNNNNNNLHYGANHFLNPNSDINTTNLNSNDLNRLLVSPQPAKQEYVQNFGRRDASRNEKGIIKNQCNIQQTPHYFSDLSQQGSGLIAQNFRSAEHNFPILQNNSSSISNSETSNLPSVSGVSEDRTNPSLMAYYQQILHLHHIHLMHYTATVLQQYCPFNSSNLIHNNASSPLTNLTDNALPFQAPPCNNTTLPNILNYNNMLYNPFIMNPIMCPFCSISQHQQIGPRPPNNNRNINTYLNNVTNSVSNEHYYPLFLPVPISHTPNNFNNINNTPPERNNNIDQQIDVNPGFQISISSNNTREYNEALQVNNEANESNATTNVNSIGRESGIDTNVSSFAVNCNNHIIRNDQNVPFQSISSLGNEHQNNTVYHHQSHLNDQQLMPQHETFLVARNNPEQIRNRRGGNINRTRCQRRRSSTFLNNRRNQFFIQFLANLLDESRRNGDRIALRATGTNTPPTISTSNAHNIGIRPEPNTRLLSPINTHFQQNYVIDGGARNDQIHSNALYSSSNNSLAPSINNTIVRSFYADQIETDPLSRRTNSSVEFSATQPVHPTAASLLLNNISNNNETIINEINSNNMNQRFLYDNIPPNSNNNFYQSTSSTSSRNFSSHNFNVPLTTNSFINEYNNHGYGTSRMGSDTNRTNSNNNTSSRYRRRHSAGISLNLTGIDNPMDLLSAATSDSNSNYEALLTLSERLGDVKPKGLSKLDIECLVCYRFNPEIHKFNNDYNPTSANLYGSGVNKSCSIKSSHSQSATKKCPHNYRTKPYNCGGVGVGHSKQHISAKKGLGLNNVSKSMADFNNDKKETDIFNQSAGDNVQKSIASQDNINDKSLYLPFPQSSCVICMSDFEARCLIRVMPCNHEYHSKCIDKWLKNNRTCPICRCDIAERIASIRRKLKI